MAKHRNPIVNSATGLPEAAGGLAQLSSAPVNDELAPEPIDPDHIASVQRGLEQSRRQDYATTAEVEAAFAQFGR